MVGGPSECSLTPLQAKWAMSSQALIFEKFARLTDQQSAGGAGLGLAICREVMEKLGGSIEYVPGQGGASFRVVLPGTPAVAA